MKRLGCAVMAAFVSLGVFPALAAPPPHPKLAREIREGRRPPPDFLRQFKEQGPPKLRGDRQVRKLLRELKLERTKDSGIQSLPAPGAVPVDGDARVRFPAPPASGSVNTLALLASFADVPPWEAPEYFDDLVFGFDGSAYGSIAPSLSHYYREVSGDRFSLVTEHLPSSIQCAPGFGPCTVASPPGWLPLPQNKAAYRADLRAMLVDAVAAADDSVDFSRYDSDGDGFVDYLILVHAGSGGEYTGANSDIWSQTVNVATPVATADGVSVNTFLTVPEYWFATQYGRMTIGVYAHEFGHLLGLPDLYDLSLNSKGIGDWGLMGLGMWNGPNPNETDRGESPAWPCAWSRVALGWVVPENPRFDIAGVVLAPVEQVGTGRGGPVYYLWDYGNENSEFFLIENRRKLAGTYDVDLPGSGLLIWHIDEAMPDNNTAIPATDPAKHEDCAWPNHFRVALQQADGSMNLENDVNDGDIADPYPGSFSITAFSPTSTGDFLPRTPPNSGSYADCTSLVAVRNIRGLGDSIQVDLEVSGPPIGSILIDNGAETTAVAAVTLALSASMTGGSSLGFMRFRNGGVDTWDGWEPFQTTKDWVLTDGAGTKTVYAQFMDYDGNISDSDPVTAGEQGYEDTIIFFPLPAGTILINNDAAATADRAVTLTLAASFPGGSGLGYMRFRNGGVSTWSGWESYRTARSWKLTSGAGTKSVHAQFKDSAGNIANSEDTILLDCTRPTGAILINNGAPATVTTAVTLFLSAADTGGSGLEAMRLRNDGVSTWGGWEPYKSTRLWELTAGAGKKTVYAQFRDNAGNISDANPGAAGLQAYEDRIIHDPAAPTGSIRINGGAAATVTTAVTLSLPASDTGGSGLGSMRFRNGGVGEWDSWEPYRKTRAWVLTDGAGIKTVYVQFRDNAGNVSDSDPATAGEQGYEDTIQYTGP